MKDVQCYELFGGIALKNAFLFFIFISIHLINEPNHMCSHIIDWVVVGPDDDIHKKSTVTDSLVSDHYCIKFYFNVSVTKLVHG